MKYLKLILPIFLISILFSCGVKKEIYVNKLYPPTVGNIPIIQTNQPLPNNLIRIGSIVVGEGGLTPSSECSYEACMQIIETEGRKVGAQIIYLVRIKEPNFESTCYNITADLYRYIE